MYPRDRPPVSSRRRGSVLVWLLLAGVVGCGLGEDASGRLLDQVGVFEQEGIPEWRTHPEPDIRIGGERTDPGHLVSGVRSARFSGSDLVIADLGSLRLLWFGAGGELKHTAGGRGLGPGEFQTISGLYVLDSGELVAYDGRLFRASLFDHEGQLVETHLLDLSTMRSIMPMPIGTLGNDITFRDRIPTSDRRNQPAGMFADSALIISAPLSGAPRKVVAFHAHDAMLSRYGGGWGTREVLFGGERLVATSVDGLVLLDTETGELRRLTGTGGLERRVVLPSPTIPVEEAWVTTVVDSLIEADEGQWRRFAGQVADETIERAVRNARIRTESTPIASSMPPYSELIASSCGQLWIGENLPPGATRRRWVVVDRDLELQGRIELGAVEQILAVDCDRVALRSQGSLGLEEISVFRIIR